MNDDLLHEVGVEAFRQRLLEWGTQNLRSFPWRMTRDPYLVLMAEIMLHRTRVDQVIPVYQRFVAAYPTLGALTQASEGELFEVLHPLGLHWRIRLVYEMAQVLRVRFACTIPERFEDLTSLPGVSHYIAGAVRCFAWNYPEPLADTNTVRVMSRFLGFAATDSTRRSKWFRRLMSQLVDPEEPRLFNYALLDLAHLICTSTKPPACDQCPLREMCIYASEVHTPRLPPTRRSQLCLYTKPTDPSMQPAAKGSRAERRLQNRALGDFVPFDPNSTLTPLVPRMP